MTDHRAGCTCAGPTRPGIVTIVCAASLILSGCDQQSSQSESQDVNPGVLPADDGTSLVNPSMEYLPYTPAPDDLVISRQAYVDKLYGFWLGQCIANWTGLHTI